MDKLKSILYLIALGLSLAGCLFSIIRAVIKKMRKDEGICVSDITGVIMDNMIRVEELYDNFQNFGSNFSNNKLEDVLTKVQNFCLSNGLNFDKGSITQIVENLINFSKKVNAKK